MPGPFPYDMCNMLESLLLHREISRGNLSGKGNESDFLSCSIKSVKSLIFFFNGFYYREVSGTWFVSLLETAAIPLIMSFDGFKTNIVTQSQAFSVVSHDESIYTALFENKSLRSPSWKNKAASSALGNLKV
eukprot:334057_1